jgi:hypothetical protein
MPKPAECVLALVLLVVVAGLLAPSASSAPFRSCAEARAAGAAPLYAGQPGYSRALDRDGDGVACETDGPGVAAPPPVPAPVPSAPPPAVAAKYAVAACYSSSNSATIPITERPTTLNFYCRFDELDGLTWSSWGPNGAVGTGSETIQISCDPSCAAGPSVTNPVNITASNPQPPSADTKCPPGVLFFTDVEISYPRTAPPDGVLAYAAGTDPGASRTVTQDGMPAGHFVNHRPTCG